MKFLTKKDEYRCGEIQTKCTCQTQRVSNIMDVVLCMKCEIVEFVQQIRYVQHKEDSSV